ncbi:MAG: tryptophan--tRNA ligase [Planctomycetota bacterium]|nr:tryptophan--tRNA ligase [Planctomycetota bacterium]
MRSLSGVQPSGKLHIANYLGAIRQFIELQDSTDGFYFIANLHALTTISDSEMARQYAYDVALDFLALGLDPERSVLFMQSDIPQIPELAWYLSCVTSMGLLQRCHAYKDKVARGQTPNHGLFAYPVLMAADILAFDSDIVPVGEDQRQHVEVTRDIAVAFNNAYGETLKVPEAKILKSRASICGTDGQKMSKSYGNTIDIFAPKGKLKKMVMGIVTDSKGLEEPKDAETNNVFNIYRHLASEEEAQQMKQKLEAGGYGYGHAKKELLNKIHEVFGEAREKREKLVNDMDYVDSVLAQGAKTAREAAHKVLEKVRQAAGIPKRK